jgi:hypothetical protein
MPRCQRRGEARQRRGSAREGAQGQGLGVINKDRGEANAGRGWLGSGAVMDELGVGCPRLQFACREIPGRDTAERTGAPSKHIGGRSPGWHGRTEDADSVAGQAMRNAACGGTCGRMGSARNV